MTKFPREAVPVAESPVVVIEHLTKRYGEFTALSDLSLTISQGQILGLIGPNGAGKTTAIRILVGLSRPTSGTARIAGADCLTEARRIKHLVGYMPDKFGSYDNMRVYEYLDFFGAAFGIPPRRRRERIEDVLTLTNTLPLRDKYVESLSHGMGQRVGIARTLLHDPQVLILDEPANGLDPQARIEMRELLLKLAGMGKTLLVTSHILPELARICHRMAIITHGQLRAYGTVEEIGRQVSHQRTVEVQLVRAEQVPQAAAVLRRSVEPDAEVVEAAAEGAVRFRTSYHEAELAGVLSALIQAGIQVAQFREVQTDLEEAFLTFARPAESPRKAAHVLAAAAGRP
uniref:ABC transporter ATP-binding protein n=1 Tax=Schlesneria paludicola TaxID=360056 RepID=A0A7C4QNU4_9PLAN